MLEDIKVLTIKRIDDDRRVAHVRIGDLTIRSLWIVGIESGKPRTSWPETGKGYPIIEAGAELKARVDQLVLEYAGIATTRSPSSPRRPRGRPRRGHAAHGGALAEPDFDDPLDDLFGGPAA